MKPLINYDDFAKLDLRVGEVVSVEEVVESEKLMKLVVDFGSEIGQKVIFSGIKKWYTASSVLNKKFIFVVNLEPKKFPFGESYGMILAVDTDKKPLLLNIKKNVTNGSTIK